MTEELESIDARLEELSESSKRNAAVEEALAKYAPLTPPGWR